MLHHLDPRLKVGGLALVSLAITMTHWIGLILTAVMLVVLVRLGRTPLKLYRSLLIILIWLGLFYGLATGWVWPENKAFWYGHWSTEGLILAFYMLSRIALLFSLTRLFTAVTMPLEQGLGITYFFKPLTRITPKAAEFSLLLTLTLRFIPLIVEEAAMIWKARLLKSNFSDSWIRRSWEVVKLIVPLILLSLRRAEELAENLMARGYASGNYRVLIFHEWAVRDRVGVMILGFWVVLLLILR